MQRYALETLYALDSLLASGEVSPSFEFVVLAPHGTPAPALKRIRFETVGPLTGHAWEQITLPLATRGKLLLSFGPTGPFLKKDQIVTIHDLAVFAVPTSFSPAFRILYRMLLPALMRRALRVMTVSNFSKLELLRCFGAAAMQVRVSGEGWQHVLRTRSAPETLRQFGLEPQRYVLAVASLAPHKNLEILAQALRQARLRGVQVVIAGGADSSVFGATDLGDQSLRLLGHVSDQQLRTLYENAAAFVFPSLYEGFGLPPLEAMALGCPVIVSRAAAIPETCGDAALYFTPNNQRELAELMERIVSDPETRAELARKARAHLQLHSWNSAARAHLEVLTELLQPHGTPKRLKPAPASGTRRLETAPEPVMARAVDQ